MAEKKKTLTVSLLESQVEYLSLIASKDGNSISQVLRTIINEKRKQEV